MSALEVIRLIEELPQADRREVFEYMHRSEAESGVKYASVDQVKRVSSRVFDTNEELFQKLAQ